MSFFDGVTFSWTGLVVLAFVVLGLGVTGEVIFGERIWAKVTLAGVLAIGGVAQLKPDDFSQGLTTHIATKTQEAQEKIDPILAALTSFSVPAPPPGPPAP